MWENIAPKLNDYGSQAANKHPKRRGLRNRAVNYQTLPFYQIFGPMKRHTFVEKDSWEHFTRMHCGGSL
ncbi:MAG: hypothetical protein OXC63_11155, partial [Aestuariivita sp.]|nr:hypothetical protein [Aestuariivita sp.]MCY4347942.1 hypothetical protein [Aestuariivita sp.]